jgi:hypothetical protein
VGLEWTQPLTEMNTSNMFLGVKGGRHARKADNLTAIYEAIVWKMWEPQHLTTQWASTACYRDTFTLLFTACVYTLHSTRQLDKLSVLVLKLSQLKKSA